MSAFLISLSTEKRINEEVERQQRTHMVTLKKEQEIYEEHRLYEFAERDHRNLMGSVFQRDRYAQTRAFEEKTSANKQQIRS